MGRRLPTSIALALLLATTARAQSLLQEVYRLTESGEGTKDGLDQTLSFRVPRDAANPRRWIVERVRVESKACGARSPRGACRRTDLRFHDWIDSDTCPALVPALERLALVDIPSFAGPNGITSFDISHVTVLTIEGPPKFARSGANPRYGGRTLTRVSIREQVGFFRQWWSKTATGLEPCWQDAAPTIAGKRIEATLPTTR